MPRPKKDRRIGYLPRARFFKPVGINSDKAEINLTFGELEAIRLKDKLGLTQNECAQKMKISRPTFQRILSAARKKLANAIIEGRPFRFKGGNYRLGKIDYRCLDCRNEFQLPLKNRGHQHRYRGGRVFCPNCGSTSVKRMNK